MSFGFTPLLLNLSTAETSPSHFSWDLLQQNWFCWNQWLYVQKHQVRSFIPFNVYFSCSYPCWTIKHKHHTYNLTGSLSAEICLNSSAAEENCWLMVGVHPSPHLVTSKIQLMKFQQLLQARLEEHSNTKGNGLYFCRKVCKSLFCTSWKFNKDSGNYTNVYCNMFQWSLALFKLKRKWRNMTIFYNISSICII